MLNKRGQISIFVIIAIVIVAAALFFLVIQPQIAKPALSAEEAQKLLASQIEPIRTYTEGCMATVARKTLNTMGRQGGYIFPRSARYTYPSSVMDDAPMINYALFYDNDAGYINQLPSVEEMQNEVSSFITEGNEDFKNCINDYKQFTKQLDVRIAGPLATTTDMSGEQIFINFTYPVELSLGEAKTSVDNYAVTIPVNIYKIREVAARIVNSVVEGKPFEKIISEEALIQEINLRTNPENSEKIFISGRSYNDFTTLEAGKTYNSKNNLFKIEYNRAGLDKPFDFYFVIGSEY